MLNYLAVSVEFVRTAGRLDVTCVLRRSTVSKARIQNVGFNPRAGINPGSKLDGIENAGLNRRTGSNRV